MSELMRDMLLAAKQAKCQAEQDYRDTIEMARNQGWSNTEIARVVGTTEAAIRMYYRRHPNREVLAQ